MADELLWELTLELHDGAAPSFRELMSGRPMPSAEVNGKEGRYGWTLSGDGATAVIFFQADDGPGVCWAGDWTDAVRHLSAIGEDLSHRVLELGQPANLVSYDAPELSGQVPPLAEPKPIFVPSPTNSRNRVATGNEGRKAVIGNVA